MSGPGWGWNFDQYYETLQKAGIEVVPCIQGCAPYLVENQKDRGSEKPILKSTDSLDPKAYAAHSSFLYQFVARSGGVKTNPTKLKIKE